MRVLLQTGSCRRAPVPPERRFIISLLMLASLYMQGVGKAGAQEAFQDFVDKDHKAFEQFRQREAPQPTKGRSRIPREDGSVLVSRHVEPSDLPQTLPGVQDRITVTVPAGALTEPVTVTVREARENGPVPIRDLAYRTLAAIELDLAPSRALAKPLTIEARYNPADLNPRVTPADQVRGMRWDPDGERWLWLPMAGVDADRGRAAVECSQTGLVRWVSTAFDVSPIAAAAPQRSVEGVVVISGLVFAIPLHCLYEYEFVDSLQSTSGNFVVLCNEADIRNSSVVGDAAKAWPVTNSTYTATVPRFVTDLMRYADESLAAYINAGFPCPSRPIVIKLDGWMVRSLPDPAFYEWTWGRIHMNTDHVNKMTHEKLRHRIAHEVFHAVQHEMLGASWAQAIDWGNYIPTYCNIWWLEACAEYASCRIPWVLKDVGGIADLYPRMSEYPLPQRGRPPGVLPLVGALEYDRGMFIDYLCRQPGFIFKDLNDFVKRTQTPALSALDAYLKSKTGKDMIYHYRRFAHWFALSSDPSANMTADELARAATWSDPLPPYTEGATQTISIARSCKPEPPYSAQLWRVAISPQPDQDQWVKVTAETCTGTAIVDVFAAEERVPGQPLPAGVLPKAGASLLTCVRSNECLFVMVSNPSERPQAEATVRVEMSPPLESTHEFLPPHAEEVRLQWTPPWSPPDVPPVNVSGLRIFVQRAVPSDPTDSSSPCNVKIEMITNVLLQANATEADLSIRDWGSKIGKIGFAIETRQETSPANRAAAGVAISPVYWGKQNPSIWRDYWDTAGTRLREQYAYLVDWGGMKMREGLDTRWYENGQKEIEGQRKWSAFVGLWRRWWEDGRPRDELEFVRHSNSGPQGERHGRYRGWNSEGGLVAEGQYDRACKTGAWKFWHNNGRLSSEGSYRYAADWPAGPSILFNLPFEERAFEEGRHQEVGVMIGRWIFYHDNGNRKAERMYDAEGKLDGKVSEWYASGRPERECEYAHGQLVEGSCQNWEDK